MKGRRMKWKSIEEDGYPTEEGVYLVTHEYYYPFNQLSATFRPDQAAFVFGPSVPHLPSFLPLAVTHWLVLPDVLAQVKERLGPILTGDSLKLD